MRFILSLCVRSTRSEALKRQALKYSRSSSVQTSLAMMSPSLQTSVTVATTTTHLNCDDTYLQPKEVNSSTWPLVAAKAAEKTKDREYGEAVRNGPHKLLPLVFETYGACGPQLNEFFAQVQAREAEKVKNIGIEASDDGRSNNEI